MRLADRRDSGSRIRLEIVVIYPDWQVAAINRMIIPVGRAVPISLTSGTVMQAS